MKKNNIAAVLLAVMMICLVPFKIYAAGIPSLEDAKSDCIRHMGNVKLSDFYYKFINVSGLNSDYATFVFVNQDVADSNKNLLIYKYYYTNSYQLRFAKFENGEVVDINADRTRFGVNYTIDGAWLNCTGNSGSVVINQSNFEKYYNSEIETNLPYFDSLDSAKAYYETGDTSGLLNSDKVSSYDPSIEVPQDFKITFSGNKLFRDDGSVNQSDFQFEWSQSDDIDLQDYRTEIYVQATIAQMNIIDVFKKNYSKTYLTDKLLLVDCTTDYSNSQSVKWDDFYKVINEDFGTHWDTSQPVGVEPFFFWIRNIKGNSYSDWVKVKVTKNNIVTSGNELTGSGTVTKGYEQIDGSSGETKTDSSYGKTYHVDPDTKSVSSIIDYIKNGFGLLGDDGLIALFKETFSFLPAPVWTCIISMIAATCIIVIWKVVH